jgi:DNA replication and repair protein RecF
MVDIGTGRDPAADPGSDRRVVRIDGAPARSQAALAEHLAAVWLTPQMDRLFVEGASGRRRFLDRLVYGFDPSHAGRLTAWDKAMRQRARLLQQGPRDPAWLNALEESMAARAVEAAAARRLLADRLNAAASNVQGGFPVPRLAALGEIEGWLAELPAPDAETRARARLAADRGRDAEAGAAGLGPHRSDLAVFDAARDLPAALCSTGEQKALLIAIVLASARLIAAERGGPPLLLLDEVAAHLDEGRRRALFDAILALGAQAWLTGTDAATFAPLTRDAQFVRIEDAVLTPD